MPVDKQVILRQQVLNRCFRNPYREYTLDDLVNECNKVLRNNDEMEISRRTIQSDINKLIKAPYYIRLRENFKRGRQKLFRYVDTDYNLPISRLNDKERNKIEDALYVLKQFEGEPQYDWARTFLMQIEGDMFDEDTSPVVTFQSNPDLKGLHHFKALLQAIMTKRVLKLRYTPFGKDTLTVRIYPYNLKQYNDRWYLIAQVVGYDSFSNYPLDRIEDFEEIALPYKELDDDLSDYFDDVVGITIPEGGAHDIIIKVYKESMGFVLTKPIHLSQRIIERSNDYVTISINVKPNYELDSKILSFGPNIQVLSPESYKNHIIEKIKAMSNNYMNNAENLHSK